MEGFPGIRNNRGRQITEISLLFPSGPIWDPNGCFRQWLDLALLGFIGSLCCFLPKWAITLGSLEFASQAKTDTCQVQEGGLINTKFIKGLCINPQRMSQRDWERKRWAGNPELSLAMSRTIDVDGRMSLLLKTWGCPNQEIVISKQEIKEGGGCTLLQLLCLLLMASIRRLA